MIINPAVPSLSAVAIVDLAERLLLATGREVGDAGRLFVDAELDAAGPFHPDDVGRLLLASISIGTALAATAAMCDVGVTDLEGPGASTVESDDIAEMIRLASQLIRSRSARAGG